MTRLLAALGFLLVIGFFLALQAPLPSIFTPVTVPPQPDELWRLNSQ